MGTPKHPLFLMGRRFRNTDKQLPAPATPHTSALGQVQQPSALTSAPETALGKLQQCKAQLVQSLLHAAMAVSHCWRVKVAHPSKTASNRRFSGSGNSTSSCSSSNADSVCRSVETCRPTNIVDSRSHTVQDHSQHVVPTINTLFAASAATGSNSRLQAVDTGSDVEAQHAQHGTSSSISAQPLQVDSQGNSAFASGNTATARVRTNGLASAMLSDPMVCSSCDQISNDVEAQRASADSAVRQEPGQARDIPEDVAAEAARVEAFWTERNTLGSEILPNQAQDGPAIVCRNLRKVNAVDPHGLHLFESRTGRKRLSVNCGFAEAKFMCY